MAIDRSRPAAPAARRGWGIVRPGLFFLLLVLTPGLVPGVLFAQNASALGYSGLMLVPTAEIAQDGELTGGISRIPELYATDWWPNRRTVFWGRIGLLPFIEAGGMFVRPDHYGWGFGDRSVFVKLRLLRERGRRPALTIGSQDFFAIKGLTWETSTAQHFGSLYLVASRHAAIRGVPLHVHLGYGPDWLVAKTKMLVGLFGGVTCTPHRMVTLLAEYDSECCNAGVRLNPFPFLQAQVAWWKLREVTATLALSVSLQ
jgi:hypothetical protein